MHRLGDPRPGETLDDRPAFFRCDRRGNYNYADAQVQHGGFNLIAILCLGHVAGVARWHSTRCAHGSSGKRGQNPRPLGQYFYQRADFCARADPHGGYRHRRIDCRCHGISVRSLRHRHRHACRDQAGGPFAGGNGPVLWRNPAPDLYEGAILMRAAGDPRRRAPQRHPRRERRGDRSTFDRHHRRRRIVRTLLPALPHGGILGAGARRVHIRLRRIGGGRLSRAPRRILREHALARLSSRDPEICS